MSLNYVTLGSNDVARARGFYDSVLSEIGGVCVAEYPPHAVCYEMRGGGRIWVVSPHNEQPAVPGNGSMVGLKCNNRTEVVAAYRVGLENGGTSEGDPGPRPLYGPNFYGAYLRDLDGNKISLVHFE